MQFTHLSFLPLAAAVLALYYLVPPALQWKVLLAASIGFYLGNGPESLAFLCTAIVSTWLCTRLLSRNQSLFSVREARQKNRPLILLWMAVNLGALLFCKIRFTFGNILLPMGISFYLFQATGYILDVYRGTERPQSNLWKLALFLSWFPQLIQGPISRHRTLGPALTAPHPFNGRQVSFGLQRMLWGYFKKLVIADRIAPAVLALRGPDATGTAFLLLTVLYALQIYADFTGGIDIALGLSEAFGIPLPENFVRPFFSRSVAEYWRRWHITLGQWMKDYVFYPFSVSAPMRALSKTARKKWGAFGKRLPVYAASVVTWLCTGIWHGLTPNFLLWGMLNCAVIILSEELAPLYAAFHRRFSLKEARWYRIFQVLRTFFLMNLIRIADLFPDVGEYFRRMGTLFLPTRVPWDQLGLTGWDWLLLLCGVILMTAVSLMQERFGSLRALLWERPLLRYCLTFLLFLTVLLTGCYGIGYDSTNFIYNQF